MRRSDVWLNGFSNRSRVVTHNRNTADRRSAARAVAISRAINQPAALTTLILSVILGLLPGAVWMLAT